MSHGQKELELGDTLEAEAKIIASFLKSPKRIDPFLERKGITVDEEWVKELLRRCAHIHWVEMEEYEKRVSGRGKAELEHEDWHQTGMPAWVIEFGKAFFAQWEVQKAGTANVNMNPPGGPTTYPLADIYREVWASWDEADWMLKNKIWTWDKKKRGLGKFSPNICSDRYDHDHKRPDRHDFWNPAARLLLKIIEWLGYTEPNVRGLIDTMREKRKPSVRNTPPIDS
jgi:hypothetical protein